MAGNAKAKATRRTQLLKRPAAEPLRLVRRRPAANRRRVKVQFHLRGKRPRGLTYKKEAQSIEIGVCNQCGEICIHCRAKGIIRLKEEQPCESNPPRDSKKDGDGEVELEEHGGAQSDSIAGDLANIMDEDSARSW